MGFNSIIAWIIRSPLHGFVSKNMMLISYTGRKSGKTYTTPVNYVRVGGALLTTSQPDRTWWRNLRGGAPVILHLQGKAVQADAEAIEETAKVASMLGELCKTEPRYAGFLKIRLNGAMLDPQELSAAAQGRVIIRTIIH